MPPAHQTLLPEFPEVLIVPDLMQDMRYELDWYMTCKCRRYAESGLRAKHSNATAFIRNVHLDGAMKQTLMFCITLCQT